MSSNKKEIITNAVKLVDELINIINLFPANRHGSIAMTRLEEAIMWMNVMVASYPLKEESAEESKDTEPLHIDS